jgi:hypothetical protein
MSVVVLLEIQVKPEALDEMKAFLKKNLPDTRAYDGCQGLDVYGNLEDTGEFIPIKPLAATGSSAPGSCAGHSRVPSPDRGRLLSTGGCGL